MLSNSKHFEIRSFHVNADVINGQPLKLYLIDQSQYPKIAPFSIVCLSCVANIGKKSPR